jgi:hypothetical protein
MVHNSLWATQFIPNVCLGCTAIISGYITYIFNHQRGIHILFWYYYLYMFSWHLLPAGDTWQNYTKCYLKMTPDSIIYLVGYLITLPERPTWGVYLGSLPGERNVHFIWYYYLYMFSWHIITTVYGADSRGPDSCRIETVHMHICNRTILSILVQQDTCIFATGHMQISHSCWVSSAFVFLTNLDIFTYVLLLKYTCPVAIRVFLFLVLFTRDSCIFAYVLL